MRNLAVELEKSGRCGFDSGLVKRQFESSLARWNMYGREAAPDVELWQRLARFRAELEGTAKILALKRQRSRSHEWPPVARDIIQSRCSDGVWRYERRPGPSMTLEFSQQIPAEQGDAIAYPLRYTY